MPLNIDQKIEIWKNKLLDLGKRNRLINYRETKRSTLSIKKPDAFALWDSLVENDKPLEFPFYSAQLKDAEEKGKKNKKNVVGEKTENVVEVEKNESEIDEEKIENVDAEKGEADVAEEKAPEETPSPESSGNADEKNDENVEDEESAAEEYASGDVTTNQRAEELQRTLRSLRNQAKLAIEEQGVNILYLAFGFLKWSETSSGKDQLTSPLILVPVSLTVESISSPFVLQKTDDEIVVNPALKFKLESEYGVTLPEFEEDDFNLEKYLNSVQERVKNNWSVAPEVGLSLFSFLKINMYNDLIRNKDLIVSNPIVRAIAGDASVRQQIPDGIDNYDFDKELKPEEVYQVLDADSSQQDAVLYAKKGISFVLQGPPGTGKSQTISNIIAELLANGKKVLFVAEKQAALEVVYKRLSACGLKEFCLVLHSRKANKKEVLEQLRATLALAEKRSSVKQDALDKLEELRQTREILNRYAEQIFEPVAPLGKTIYEVNGILAGLQSCEDVELNIENIGAVDSERYNLYVRELKEYRKIVEESAGDITSNPWNGSNVQTINTELRLAIQSRLPSTADKIGEIAAAVREIFGAANLNIPCSYQSLKEASGLFAVAGRSPGIPSRWITDNIDVNSLRQEVSQYEEKTNAFNDKVLELQQAYREINAQGICEVALREARDLNAPEAIDSEQALLDRCADSDSVLAQITKTPDFNSLLAERRKAEEQKRRSDARKETLTRQFTDDVYRVDYQDVLSRYRSSYLSFENEVRPYVRPDADLARSSDPFPLISNASLWDNPTTIQDAVKRCEERKDEYYAKVKELVKVASSLTKNEEFAVPDVDRLTTPDALEDFRARLKSFAAQNPALAKTSEEGVFDRCRNELAIVESKSAEIQRLRSEILQKFNREIFDLDYEKMLARHKAHYRSFFKFLIGSYRADRRAMSMLYKDFAHKIDDVTILSALTNLKEIDDARKETDRDCSCLKSTFGDAFRYEETDFQKIKTELGACEQLLKAYAFIDEELEILREFDPDSEKLSRRFGLLYNGLDTSWDAVRSALDLIAEFRKRLVDDKSAFQACWKNKDEKITERAAFETMVALESERKEKEDFGRAFAQLSAVFGDLVSFEKTDFPAIDKRLTTYRAIDGSKATLDEAKAMLAEFVSAERGLKERFGFLYDRAATSWPNARKALDWAEEFKNVVLQYSPNEEFIQSVCSDPAAIDACKTFDERVSRKLPEAESDLQWLAARFENPDALKQKDFQELADQVRQCAAGSSALEEWIDYKKAVKTCEENGLADFIRQIEERRIKPDRILPVFQKRFFHLWLDAILPKYPAVMEFRRKKQDDAVELFSKLDKLQFEIAKARIRDNLINALPLPYKLTSGGDEIDVLKRELGKQRRIMPIRKLFRQIPNLLTSLKPCMMTSPLTVSLFLESQAYEFDAVIFDEASQICTENAICAIARGKQVVITGDSKQLPPTNFFSASTSDGDDYDVDEEDDDDFGAYESVLDEANRLPVKTLLWHYRSRHEHLIAFSNAKIYRNELVTFPSLVDKAPDAGVEYIYVPEGYYDRGGKKGNVLEAQRVAELVFKHFQNNPKRSLGVVAFGEVQQQAIESAIREKRLKNPEYESFFKEDGDESFFVKNLENVQGDERDTIIFSIGYAKDSKGVFRMNFGPLSKVGGERRLNVAITRAKYNIKLVGSILPTDIDVDRVSADGPKLLRSYIEFAQNGFEALQGKTSADEDVWQDYPFEKEIYNFLLQKGYQLSPHVGCSGYRIDMAVKSPNDPSRYVIGIECDGPAYHSARTARDRDRLRRDVLKGMGWKLYRVWSTDWVKDPEAEGKLLIEAVENALSGEENKEPAPTTAPAELEAEDLISLEERVDSPEEEDNLYNFEEEREVSTKGLSPKSSKNFLPDYILAIVNQLYPVHFDVICKMVAERTTAKRVTEKLKTDVSEQIRQIAPIIRKGDFFFPVGYTEIKPRVNTRKNVAHIAPEELAEAMIVVLSKSVGTNTAQLCAETARAYRFSRMTPAVAAAMDEAFDLLLKQGRIEIVDDKVKIAD
ncbi:MAG: DUF4011 domain-containing protein [Thermoguttaceae bacterium]|nr:DUF4011 domain-containing protein [Thermoguttaceae bacterium]